MLHLLYVVSVDRSACNIMSKLIISLLFLLSCTHSHDAGQTQFYSQHRDHKYLTEETKRLRVAIKTLNRKTTKYKTRKNDLNKLDIGVKTIRYFIEKVAETIWGLSNAPENATFVQYSLSSYNTSQTRLAVYQKQLCQQLTYSPGYIYPRKLVTAELFSMNTIIQEINTLNNVISSAQTHLSFVLYVFETEECYLKSLEFKVLYLRQTVSRHIENIRAALKSTKLTDTINLQVDLHALEIDDESDLFQPQSTAFS